MNSSDQIPAWLFLGFENPPVPPPEGKGESARKRRLRKFVSDNQRAISHARSEIRKKEDEAGRAWKAFVVLRETDVEFARAQSVLIYANTLHREIETATAHVDAVARLVSDVQSLSS